jgi:hypothetical protein
MLAAALSMRAHSVCGLRHHISVILPWAHDFPFLTALTPCHSLATLFMLLTGCGSGFSTTDYIVFLSFSRRLSRSNCGIGHCHSFHTTL